jgi:hypothetical protein
MRGTIQFKLVLNIVVEEKGLSFRRENQAILMKPTQSQSVQCLRHKADPTVDWFNYGYTFT